MKTKLWSHQQDIVDTIKDRKRVVINSFMRSGKTLALLTFLEEWLGQNPDKKVLILVPSGVMRNRVWETQAQEHGFPYPILHLDQRSTKLRLDALNKHMWQVVVSNYEGFWRKPLFDAIRQETKSGIAIYDEVHRLKSPNGTGSKKAALLHKEYEYIIGLTGTLVPNGYKDLYGIGRAVDNQYFGTRYADFKAHYCIMGGPNLEYVTGYVHEDELFKLSSGLVKTIVNDGLVDMPEVTTSRWTFNLGREERRAYEDMKEHLVTSLDVSLEDFLEGNMDGNYVAAANVLVKLTKLRQISSGFVYDQKVGGLSSHIIDNSRLHAFGEILDDISDEPFIVWTNYSVETKQVQAELHRRGFTSVRHDALKHWQDGEVQALVHPLSASTEGVDCTRAALNIIYSPTYDWQSHAQAMARTSGPRQKKKVRIIELFAKNTLDARIYSVLQSKDAMNETLNRETSDANSETDRHST